MLLQVVSIGLVELLDQVAGGARPSSRPRTRVEAQPRARSSSSSSSGWRCSRPLVEELLFRGLLLRALLRRTTPVWAVVISSVVFAAVHLLDPSTLPLMAPLLLLAVISAIRAVRTGDLSQSILLHVGFNLLSAILLADRPDSGALTRANARSHPLDHPSSSLDHPPGNSGESSTPSAQSNSSGGADRMQCSRCANGGIVEIKMKIAGEDVMFRQCGRCEAKSWLTIDGPLSLTRVLEMARVAR